MYICFKYHWLLQKTAYELKEYRDFDFGALFALRLK